MNCNQFDTTCSNITRSVRDGGKSVTGVQFSDGSEGLGLKEYYPSGSDNEYDFIKIK